MSNMDNVSARWDSPILASMAKVTTWTQRWGMLAAAMATAALGQPAHAKTVPNRSTKPVAADSTPEPRIGATMTVPLNKSQTLRVDRPLAKAIVGNADIADVVPVSQSAVYILGKSIGSTNVTLIDRKGNVIAIVDVVVGPDSQGLKRKLAELLPTEAIGVTVSNDSLVLEGNVSSAAAAERASTIAETYAPKKVLNMLGVGASQQVLLEVRFAEMSRTTVKQLGISNVSFFNQTGSGLIVAPNSGITSFTGSFSFPGGLSFQIDALEQKGLVRTLAQPNLIALSGETSSFLAGGEFPVPSSIANNGQVSYEFKPFGVSLAFTPTVLQDGLVNLVVSPEVSALDRAAGITAGGVTIPGLKVRRARTTVELRDGEALAIAGLMQSDFTDTVSAVPLLGKIPILGTLFRSSAFNKSETELVIIVTPRIVRPVSAGVLAVPTDRVLEPTDVDVFLNGNIEKRVEPKTMSQQPLANGSKPGGVAGDFGHIVR